MDASSVRIVVIQNVNTMEKSTKIRNIIIICAVIILLGLIAFFFFHTQDYWKNQMKIQNEQLELRTPEAVDSLIHEIQWRDSVMEVWGETNYNHSNSMDSIEKVYQSKLSKCENDNRILQNVIDHQNQMITNLQNKK